MATNLIYMPTFRARQQENIVLTSFQFGEHIYPMIEIVKEFDRKRPEEKQLSFQEIHLKLIEDINATKVFVDLPVYLNERASMKDEVLLFSRRVTSNREKRTEHLLQLAGQSAKIIPVVSSFLNRTGEFDTVKMQVDALRDIFPSIGFRILINHFNEDWAEVSAVATDADFIILDLDKIPPYPSPPIKQIVATWNNFNTCPKIVLRSAINSEVLNVNLKHSEIVFDADNGLLDQYRPSFKANSFGDYAGIKKDDLTSGGAISPGFLLYDAVENQFVGFKGNGGKGEDKFLSDFEDVIVPDVLNSQSAQAMKNSPLPYLSDQNVGWNILKNINAKNESGKSQAKFKRIALEHYLHCIRTKIEYNELTVV
ncbi:beta family protein [Pedobacter sp.]